VKTIVIADYGIGNILSVVRAFEYHHANVKVTDSPSDIANACTLVLPGVGAFGDGMKGLRNKGLIEPILEHCLKGKPFLGICLGMQMMLDASEEFETNLGLGIIHGEVKIIPDTGINGTHHKIPHIGWNSLSPSETSNWNGTILDNIEHGAFVYFVHSFTAVPANTQNRLADCFYNGRIISAAIQNNNIYGCQFHPEKSGRVGLQIIKNFINLS